MCVYDLIMCKLSKREQLHGRQYVQQVIKPKSTHILLNNFLMEQSQAILPNL